MTPEALEAVRRLANSFQSVIDMASELEKAAHLERAVRETEVRLAKVRDEFQATLAAHKKDMVLMHDEREEAVKQEQERQAAADSKASAMIADAEGRAREILTNATQAAMHLDRQAKAAAESATKQATEVAEARKECLQEEVRQLAGETQKAKAELAHVLEQAEKKAEELAGIEARISKAREKIAAFARDEG